MNHDYFRDVEEHKYANTCMDEFLAAKEDTAWTEGVQRLPPDQRALAVTTLAIERPGVCRNLLEGSDPTAEALGSGREGAGGGGGAGAGAPSGSGPRLGALRGFGSRGVGAEEEEEVEEEEEGEVHDMEQYNEYLKEKPVGVGARILLCL